MNFEKFPFKLVKDKKRLKKHFTISIDFDLDSIPYGITFCCNLIR